MKRRTNKRPTNLSLAPEVLTILDDIGAAWGMSRTATVERLARDYDDAQPQPRRDFAIDMKAIEYGLDSDDLDEIEADCQSRGVALVTPHDWLIQFDLARTAREAMK